MFLYSYIHPIFPRQWSYGVLVNSNVDVDDVENFFKMLRFDVNKSQGAAKQVAKSSPRLDLKCEISMKEIAVAGDVLEVCQECCLNMITIYGRFTMMSSLVSKAASELIDKTVETLQKLFSTENQPMANSVHWPCM